MTHVGYELYRQIRDLAPPGWTSGERLVAWVIADDANEETRRSFIALDELARRCGMSERGVRKALEKLAERGYEFRVSLGKGKDGRDVYSVRGMAPQYAVPDAFQLMIHAAGTAFGLVGNHSEGGTTVPPSARLSTG
jgi:biotin operon repressor